MRSGQHEIKKKKLQQTSRTFYFHLINGIDSIKCSISHYTYVTKLHEKLAYN